MKIEYKINENTTIKEFICKNISRNFYGYLKEHNARFCVNGITKKNYDEICINDTLLIEYEETKEINNNYYSDKPLDIRYEDEYFIVLYKEAHLQTIPSQANPYDSIYNRLLYYFKDTDYKVCIVNRLDKETQGLILVCKSNFSRAILKEFNKVYYATTDNKLLLNNGIIDLPIKRIDGIKRGVSYDGQNAITYYELIGEKNDLFTYKIILKTGRTHQIRVHFSHLNSPLLNDTLYGGKITDGILGLVCGEVEFFHPVKKEKVNICL